MNIQPIYPQMADTSEIHCSSCRKTKCGSGAFADLDKHGAYLCVGCTKTAIGGVKASKLLEDAQMRYFRATGGYCHGREKMPIRAA